MKKSFLTLILLGSMLFGNAQITITKNDVASWLTQFIINNDTLPAVTPGSAGAAKAWDFSSANNHTTDTVIFTAPLWTPYGTNFPNSNLCMITKGSTASYSYLKNCADSLSLLGQAGTISGIFAITPVKPTEKIMNFPSAYLSSYTNNYAFYNTVSFGQVPGYDSVRYKSTSTVQSTIDAYGTLKLKIGSYNCLRKNDYTISTDSVWLHSLADSSWVDFTFYAGGKDTTREYSWWANNVGYSLAKMGVNPTTDTVLSFSYLGALPGPGGINEAEENSIFNICPNPAIDHINIEVTSSLQNASLEVYNIQGALLISKEINTKKTIVTIDGLAKGIYFVKVKTNKDISIKKFIKD